MTKQLLIHDKASNQTRHVGRNLQSAFCFPDVKLIGITSK